MGKKDEYRFTIRFDPDDDRHQKVVQILNSQGRKIARYVARAVLAYSGESVAPDESERLPGISKEKTSSNIRRTDDTYRTTGEVEEEYEMDEEEIELLRNSNHMFRRK